MVTRDACPRRCLRPSFWLVSPQNVRLCSATWYRRPDASSRTLAKCQAQHNRAAASPTADLACAESTASKHCTRGTLDTLFLCMIANWVYCKPRHISSCTTDRSGSSGRPRVRSCVGEGPLISAVHTTYIRDRVPTDWPERELWCDAPVTDEQ